MIVPEPVTNALGFIHPKLPAKDKSYVAKAFSLKGYPNAPDQSWSKMLTLLNITFPETYGIRIFCPYKFFK